MRAIRVGRGMSRASRAIFVLLMALAAAGAGAAVAHAEPTWEFAPVSDTDWKRPGVVVQQPATADPAPAGDSDPTWE